MKPVYMILACLLALPAVARATGQIATVPALDEKPLWELWQFHLASSNLHDAVAERCAEMAKSTHLYPLTLVAEGLGAWHLLKAEKQDEAVKLLDKLAAQPASGPSLPVAAANLGKGWLTRIDRERVRAALQAHYRQEVQYPDNLEPLQKLPAEVRPPARDRYNKLWSYRIVNFKKLRGFQNQKYELSSNTLGARSDLKTELARPYGDAIRLKPVRIMSATPGRETITFERTVGDKTETVHLSVGSKIDDIEFAYLGPRLLILGDGSHWMIMPRPR